MLSIIALPTGFVGDITDTAGQVMTDLSPITTLLIGVLMGLVIIQFIIGAIKN